MLMEPDDADVTMRMRRAHGQACTALGTQPQQDTDEVWGWCGRTLSQTVTTRDGSAWLRVICARADEVNTTFWEGSVEAEKAMPKTVPRPRLRDIHDWNDKGWKYRAELYDRVADRPTSVSPVLVAAPDLPPTWWASVRTVLHDITTVPTNRLSVHQPFLDRAMPQFLGAPIDTTAPSSWSTAHGDFHWANLCAPELCVLDWEGWGLAPRGYDAAVLHIHSLMVPAAAARIRGELAYVLNTSAGRYAELVVITQLLHSITRGYNVELAEPLLGRAEHLLGRRVPSI